MPVQLGEAQNKNPRLLDTVLPNRPTRNISSKCYAELVRAHAHTPHRRVRAHLCLHAILPGEEGIVVLEARDEGLGRGEGGVGREAAVGARPRHSREVLSVRLRTKSGTHPKTNKTRQKEAFRAAVSCGGCVPMRRAGQHKSPRKVSAIPCEWWNSQELGFFQGVKRRGV